MTVVGRFTRFQGAHTVGPDRQAIELDIDADSLDTDWAYQREEAERSVRQLVGIRGVANKITIKPKPNLPNIEQRVTKAFERLADVDAHSIWLTADGSTVTLHGNVRTFAERRSAQRAAEAAPGVTKVRNHIIVVPSGLIED